MAWYEEFLNLTTNKKSCACHFPTTIKYMDGEGERDVPQASAWCATCNKIVVAESFAIDLAEGRQYIARGIAEDDSAILFLFGSVEAAIARQKQLDELEVFLRPRRSQPRCLECLKEGVVFLPREDEFMLPDGNRYRRTESGFADMVCDIRLSLNREGLPV